MIADNLMSDAVMVPEKETQYEVWQDDCMVASADTLSDAQHYAAIYGRDGPVKEVTAVTTRFPGFNIVSAMLAASPPVGGWDWLVDQHIGWLRVRADCLDEQAEPGDAENAAHFRRVADAIEALSAPPPPSVSTGSRPQEAVPAEQAEGAVVGLPEPLAFGFGALVVNTGFYGGKPAVFIARATEPGVVGAETGRAAFARDCLQPGERVMTFPSTEQANAVADAMCTPIPQPADGCSSNEGVGE